MPISASRYALRAFAAVLATALATVSVLVLMLVLVLGLAAPAQAHSTLVSSTPKEGETLNTLPSEFSITTNDVLLNIGGDGTGFALRVTDAAGRYYGDGCVKIDGPTMSTPAALGAAGQYTVTWQVISVDGHAKSDEYAFIWQPPADFAPSVGTTKVPDCNGTQSAQAKPTPAGGGTVSTPAVNDVTLSTVLWIGGAFLALAAALILTLLFTGRNKKQPTRNE